MVSATRKARKTGGGAARDPGRGKRASDFVLPFGRHRGKTLGEVPEDYVRWLAGAPDAKGSLRAKAREVLENGTLAEPDDGDDPSPDLASVALPNVIWELDQHLTREYALDPAALSVAAAAVEKLKALCSRYTRKPWLTDVQIGGAA